MASCDFSHARIPELDAGPDAPVSTQVYFTSVTATGTTIRPGRYGIEVTAVLHNALDSDVTEVGAMLTFGGRGNQFRFRDVDRRESVMISQPTTVGAGGDATFRFVVDALPGLTANDVQINGSATFNANGMQFAATPAAAPLALAYTGINAPIMVTVAQDEDDSDTQLSFREALKAAATAPGPDVIIFDPAVFPIDTVVTLSNTLGELPTISTDVVIDGRDITLAVGQAWEATEGRYGLRITGGTVVVANLTFRNFAYNYRNEMITTAAENCGASMSQLEGGAIHVSGGTLILDSNRFEDPDVAERNCFAASVRLHGGSGHRILRNRWSQQVMDSIFVAAATREITDNVMISPTNRDRDDEGIYISSQGGSDLWIVGNLIVDQEFSGIVAGGSDGGKLYIVNNTLARNGRVSSGAVRGGGRSITLRNNVYITNNPAAIEANNNGTGFDIAYETISGNTLCGGSCSSALIDMATLVTAADPGVANQGGTTRADFTPISTSPLVGSGTPYVDRNGSAPGYFTGAGPERGAFELP
jgi:hypothetical protein